jgi:hypothetical protein
MYAHVKLRQGGFTCRAKDLDTNRVFNLTIHPHNGPLVQFGKNSIPSNPLDANAYYEASDDANFPAIDSFSEQGMFQMTVGPEHPIRGIQVLKRICALFTEPKLYFVVPPHRFDSFQKQKFYGTQGNAEVQPIENLKQFVVELHVKQ